MNKVRSVVIPTVFRYEEIISSPCDVCEKPSTQCCALCRAVFYCGWKCHSQDWSKHKQVCSVLDSRSPIKPGVDIGSIDKKLLPLNLEDAEKICSEDPMVRRFMTLISWRLKGGEFLVMIPLTERSPESYRTSIIFALARNMEVTETLRQFCLNTPICILQVVPSLASLGLPREETFLSLPPLGLPREETFPSSQKGSKPLPIIHDDELKIQIHYLLCEDASSTLCESGRKSPIRLHRDSPPLLPLPVQGGGGRTPSSPLPAQVGGRGEVKLSVIILPMVNHPSMLPRLKVGGKPLNLDKVVKGQESVFILPGTNIFGVIGKVIA